MTNSAVVIGGGAIGLASAYYLQRTGWRVTVVDSGEVGQGCSGGSSGLIVPSHSHPLPGPGVIAQALRWMGQRDSPFYVKPRLDPRILRWAWQFRRFCRADAAHRGFRSLLGLSQWSLALFDELIKAQEVDFFYQRKGLLQVYVSEEGLRGAGEELRLLQESRFQAQLLTREETVKLEPALDPGVRGSLFIAGEAHGCSHAYTASVARTLAKRGARILTHRPVSRIVVHRGRVDRVVLATHPRARRKYRLANRSTAAGPRQPAAIRGLANRSGEKQESEHIEADLVVLAAGCWSSKLLRSLRISLPLQPAKGYSCTIDSYPRAPTIPLIVPERRVVITPLGTRLRFGGTLELAGFDLGVNRTRYGAVVKAACEILRDSPPFRNEEAWCGLRPLTPDGLPIIDRAPGVEGLIVATGHAMLGFTQSPATGKLVADLANHEVPSLSLAPFRLDRF